MEIKKGIIIQARTGSKRLPGKVLKKVSGISLIELLIKRLKKSKLANNIILATTNLSRDDELELIAHKHKIKCFRGSENNVLERFFMASKKYKLDYVVRITADCPLTDPKIVDEYIKKCISGGFDYLSNTNPPTYPDGFDIEVIKSRVLKKAYLQAKTKFDREHVTPYIKNHSKIEHVYFENGADFSKYRLTVDTEEDFQMINELIEKFSVEDMSASEIVNVLEKNPNLSEINNHVKQKHAN